MAEMLQKLYEEYKVTVCKNAATIGQFESAFRIFSYVIAGKFEDSAILSELLYSASNLLVLFNDTIIRSASGILPKVPASQERLKNIITVLEYVGVFVEVSAERMYGEVGRWAAIAVLQIAKEAVLKQNKSEAENTVQEESAPVSKSDAESKGASVSFVLKRSGKTMRSLSRAEPLKFRNWKVPGNDPAQPPAKPKRVTRDNLVPSKLTRKQAWGEILYILKPVIHLGSLCLCGQSSFKPWLVSSGLDIGSLCLLGDGTTLNSQEQTELRRRALMLAMYLLRSPFYDRYSKQKLLQILRGLSTTIPGVSLALVPLMEYLPVWQRIYFYTWST
ncbi:peroxisomal membrane protein PEX16-like [Elysia marginata]|uniref:Peroxisomal membrane protein PEX16 n=1 Tax=Elysia marginata TaxID=1093978 RepID=A0AAV4JF58_9GAST|nr:peroxisomal membrane protein PEX16-like [Elysia marginata]